jgi:hypothetical protein
MMAADIREPDRMRRVAWYGIVVAAGCAGVLACAKKGDSPPSEPAPTPPGAVEPDGRNAYFEDVTAASGLSMTYRNGEEAGHLSLLEAMGGGVGLLDYDRDGLLDVFLTGGGHFDGPDRKEIRGHPCKLFRNRGGWKFEDVTAAAGLDRLSGGGQWFYTHGVAAADFDNDGWTDLLVTGWGRLALFHNEPNPAGGRRFREVTREAGLSDSLWSLSAGWGDLDGDGLPDLYVTHYVDWSFANHPRCPGYVPHTPYAVCSPKSFKALPDVLYRNTGKGTFRDASAEFGLRPDGKGLGVLVADLDEDGRPDVYVANDTSGNFLYLNRGGRLEEAAFPRGVAYAASGKEQGSMGVDAADYDGTGRFSLFVTNYQQEAHALYRNGGRGQFRHVSDAAGVSAIGLAFVGFGTGFLDFDRDGAEDVFIANGHITPHPAPPSEQRQRPVLFRNTRRDAPPGSLVRFEDVSPRGGPYFAGKRIGRGAAFGDLDNDGRTDVVVSHTNEPAALLRNAADNGRHWLGVSLVGRPHADAVGAVLTLEAGGEKFVKQVKGGGSYLSSNDPRVLFGLGPTRDVASLTVRWPSGKTQTWRDLAADRYWKLTEGEPAAAELRAGP